VKTTIEMDFGVDVLDIPSMAALSDADCRAHLMPDELFWIDDHDVLRVANADFPLATNKNQLDILIDVLGAQRHKLADA
jgi:hypothetical protein